jgi:hypothetical protein
MQWSSIISPFITRLICREYGEFRTLHDRRLMSDFLVPQHQFQDFFKALQDHHVIGEYLSIFTDMSSTVIPDSDFDALYNHLLRHEGTFEADSLPAQLSYSGYRWTQDGDLVTVTYSSPVALSADDIIISEHEIQCPSDCLSGRFFDGILNHDIKVRDSHVRIQLQVRGKWPILICGGSFDSTSCFFLSLAANQYGMESLFERLLIQSSSRGHTLSISTLGIHYLERHKPDEVLFWLSKLTGDPFDDTAAVIVSEILLNRADSLSACLAENLLIRLANRGLSLAFRYLGALHFNTIDGFVSDSQLAFRYLSEAAFKYQDVQALGVVGKCYLSGLGVERDVNRGVECLQQAGVDATALLASTSLEEPPQSIRSEGFGPTLAVGSAVVALGIWMFYRWRKYR